MYLISRVNVDIKGQRTTSDIFICSLNLL